MGLGTALLQPRIAARSAPDGIAALVEDLQRLAAVMAEDAAAAGPLAGTLESALADALPRLQAQVAPRLDAARGRLRGGIAGFRGFVEGLAARAEAAGSDPAAILRLVRELLGQLRTLSAALTLPGIRQHLGTLHALVADDLGLSPAALLGLVRDFLDDLALRFGRPEPGEAADVRRRRRLAASVVASLRLKLDDIALPGLDIEALARALHRAIRDSGLAGPMAQLDCALDALDAGIAAATAAAEAARPTPRPVGAGVVPVASAAEYSWYASWLLKEESIPLLGLSDVKEERGFLNRFRTPENAIDSYIRQNWFSEAERGALDRDDLPAGEPPPRSLMLLVLGVLNREMQKGDILDDLPSGVAGAPALLTDAIDQLRGELSTRQTLLEYNRRVFERAYPQHVGEHTSRHTRHFWDHVVMPIFGDFGVTTNRVSVTSDRAYVMCDDKPIHLGENVSWHDAPIFKRMPYGLWFGFERVPAPACEIIAQVLLTTASLAKPIWHAAEVQPGHEWQAGLYSGLEFAEVLQQFLFGKPLSAHFQLLGSAARRTGVWLDSAAGWRGLSVLGTSFHSVVGRNDNNLPEYWLTTFLGDAIRTVMPARYVDILPDVVLTFITLINSGRTPFDGGHDLPSNHSANHRVQDGITKNIDLLFELWLHSVYSRDNYSVFLWADDGIGDRRTEAMAGHWFGLSCAIGLLSGVTGSVVVQTTAWVEQWDRVGLTILHSFERFFFQYWVKNYLHNENNTDDGRYRPGGGGSYRGYPDKDVAPSPYRLPMPGGVALCVGQANQGLFSHNFIANTDFVNPAQSANLQTYAYDFSHEFREPIACVRDGTVFAVNQGNPDGNTQTANTLTIRHDTIDAEHDVLGGAPVQTYTVYVHLALNGVRDAPQFGGTTPAIGTAVTQGQLIALAGDTGMSFHNHLHLHVLADDGTGNPGNRTVPFVFADVDGKGGVPQSISWHRSGNA